MKMDVIELVYVKPIEPNPQELKYVVLGFQPIKILTHEEAKEIWS